VVAVERSRGPWDGLLVLLITSAERAITALANAF